MFAQDTLLNSSVTDVSPPQVESSPTFSKSLETAINLWKKYNSQNKKNKKFYDLANTLGCTTQSIYRWLKGGTIDNLNKGKIYFFFSDYGCDAKFWSETPDNFDYLKNIGKANLGVEDYKTDNAPTELNLDNSGLSSLLKFFNDASNEEKNIIYKLAENRKLLRCVGNLLNCIPT